MKNYKLFLQLFLILGYAVTSSIYAKDQAVVFLTLGDMNYVSDDSSYGR